MEYPINIFGKTKRQVTKINLSYKGLTEIPENIYDYPNLEKLVLSHNKINVVPKEIVKLKKLRTIDLSFNKFTALQSGIFKLPKLKVLNLHGNKLKSLPKQIAASHLKILIISNNRFNMIDESLIKGIKKVIKYGNPLTKESEDENKCGLCKNDLNNEQKQVKTKIFISYSHDDDKWLKELQTHLKGLSFYCDLIYWDDKKLKPGDNWVEEINNALASANIALFLVSPSFLASDFIQNNELYPILDKAVKRGVIVIPIFVRPTGPIDECGLGQYQGANDPNKTLEECEPGEVDRILANLMINIKNYCNSKK